MFDGLNRGIIIRVIDLLLHIIDYMFVLVEAVFVALRSKELGNAT